MKKTMITFVGAVIFAVTVFAKADYNSLYKLANTPVEQITAGNAKEIYSACLAVTNAPNAINIAKTNLIAVDDMYKQALDEGNAVIMASLANVTTNLAWHAETLGVFADKIISGEFDDMAFKRFNWAFVMPIYANGKFLLAEKTDACVAIIDKFVVAGKLHAAMVVAYKHSWNNTLLKIRQEKIDTKYLSMFTAAINEGKVDAYYDKHAYFDVWTELLRTKEYDTLNTVSQTAIDKVCCDVNDSTARFFAINDKNALKFIERVQEAELKSPNISDEMRIKIAKTIDCVKSDKSGMTTAYGLITSKKDKLSVALYLADKDKVIDAFADLDNTADAKLVDQALMTINALDIDYRAADVKKALRNVNAKYTLKLYEDRDSWEPVLSKIRAMIEVR